MTSTALALLFSNVLFAADAGLWPDLDKPPQISTLKKASFSPSVVDGEPVQLPPDTRLDAALIISVDDYAFLPDVPNARKNGRDWYRFFNQTRGISPDRIMWLDDTTASKEQMLKSAAEIAKLTQDGGLLWFVFIGHGAPSNEGPQLVGVNAPNKYQALVDAGAPLVKMMDRMVEGKQRHTLAFVDASFSGRGYSGKPLVIDALPQLNNEIPYVNDTSFFLASSLDKTAGLLPGDFRPAFSYLTLGGLHGWADQDKDGHIRSREILDYVKLALRATSPSVDIQKPELIGMGDLVISSGPSGGGPDLSRIREGIDPVLVARSMWDVKIERGGGVRKDYAQLTKIAEAKASVRISHEDQERARQKLLAETQEKLLSEASKAWNIMSKARSMGGKDIYDLVKNFIKDYENAVVEVDGVRRKVEVPQVLEARQWMMKYGRFIKGALGYDMVLLNSGTFSMGSHPGEKDRDDDEKLHTVKIQNDFYMGIHEVTQALWADVMFANPSYFKDCGANCPVENISWCDALIFSNRISVREGYQPVYNLSANFKQGMSADLCDEHSLNVEMNVNANGYRLPTEAEWEYAARAGADHLYSGSDSSEKVAWNENNSDFSTHPVGQKASNNWGLHDMSGNVWECVWDVYGEYSTRNILDVGGPEEGAVRTIRGGSWGLQPKMLRVANRYHVNPGSRIRDVGLRVVRTAK